MDRISSPVEFVYNGNEIKATLFVNFIDGEERESTLMFNYKGKTVHISLGEEGNFWSVAPLHCKIIEKLGWDIYKKYSEYLSEIDSISLKHIIVNNKVYNYFSKLMISSPKVYFLSLYLNDGTNIDGTTSITSIKDKGNKRKLFRNLQIQAENYFEKHHIEPREDQLNQELTNQYLNLKNLIKNIHESL